MLSTTMAIVSETASAVEGEEEEVQGLECVMVFESAKSEQQPNINITTASRRMDDLSW